MERQQTYKEKAQHLYKVKGIKNRYNTKSAEEYFYSLPQVKYILSVGRMKKHKEYYIDSEMQIKKAALEKSRKNKNWRFEEKLRDAKRYTQKVDPEYLNIYMKSYHRRGITTEEKLEILTELKKFDTENIVRFFRKLNDAEQNIMIRNLAFKYLQDYGHYVKLRKNFKGKKKVYQIESASLDNKKPEDLYNDLTNKNIQSQKVYDIFISHSTKDKKIVEDVIKFFNEQNKTCYCDWTMDQDYLKRKYVGEYTKQVLKVRMEQSKVLVLLRTESSVQSDWVNFEIEYFESLKKPIYVIKSLNDLLEDFSV